MTSAHIIELPKILDERGNLSFLEDNNHIPFKIVRCFWTYDVPGGTVRGGHAYFRQDEIIIALSGSFDVFITNQDESISTFSLNRSYYGLYVPARTWRHMDNFSTNAVSLHLTNSEYDPTDYMRDFSEYKKA